MARRPLFEKPTLRIDEDLNQERKVSWIELFYDLVFVVSIAEIAHKLAADYSFTTFYKFILLFIPVWWVWINSTYYNERFETNGLENRIFYFLKMLAIAAMAVYIHDALGETSVQFALAYSGARLILLGMWMRATYYSKRFRPTGYRYIIGFSISILLFIGSIFVEPPMRFVIWGIALTIDLLVPFTTLKLEAQLPQFSKSKLPERFGLFIIIVLGESIVGIVKGLAEQHHLDSHMISNFVLGFSIAFGLWWIYFDFIARRNSKPTTASSFAWGYLHLPFVIFVTAIGSGILVLVSTESHYLPAEVIILMCLSLGLCLITLGLIETTLERLPNEFTHPFWSPAIKIITGVISIILMFFCYSMDLHLLMGLMILLVGINMLYGAYGWFTQKINE
ncbi:MAG: low temperature requirement protein A [Bacteroidia bacterium]|nr:low temperature requirement protein A [Bacteroidia bacterium]NNC85600.1 low temperature requirement protein A [Bacteroidia bacterium]